MVFDQQAEHESQWSAISSIASKIDCTRETLRTWVRRAERDAGKRAGLTTDERQRLKDQGVNDDGLHYVLHPWILPEIELLPAP